MEWIVHSLRSGPLGPDVFKYKKIMFDSHNIKIFLFLVGNVPLICSILDVRLAWTVAPKKF
jgi:hypothetical protein